MIETRVEALKRRSIHWLGVLNIFGRFIIDFNCYYCVPFQWFYIDNTRILFKLNFTLCQSKFKKIVPAHPLKESFIQLLL